MNQDATNPYTSPAADSDRLSEAAREIATVVRVFRFIGWIGVIFYTPLALIALGMLIYSLVVEPSDSVAGNAVGVGLCGGVLFVSFTYFRTASALRAKHPRARRAATVLSCVLLLGFPIFTIVGIICLIKVWRNFADYCRSGQ